MFTTGSDHLPPARLPAPPGRRLSVRIAMFVLGAAYLLEGTIPFYAKLAPALPLVGASSPWPRSFAAGDVFLRAVQARRLSSISFHRFHLIVW